MIQTRRYRYLVSLTMLVVGSVTSLRSAETAPHFVAGFERLGRHDEIESETAGRLLLSELSCTACHASDDPDLKSKRGPKLDGAGNRLQHDWIARFISNPNKAKPGTTMPQMLNGMPGNEKAATVEALVAFSRISTASVS
jgi:cytochrome c2